jgi:hypothetical protein
MKTYLSAIEHILGISLDRRSVQGYAFSSGTLQALQNFASDYAKSTLQPEEHLPQLTCFLPFPEILNGNFRTYSVDGSIAGHWPAFDDLANLVMICDRVIIHDHLGPYASSSIRGYAEGFRYTGLKNWLTALADWKPLILEEIICIMPQDLSCNGPFQSLWDEGVLSALALEIYYSLGLVADFKSESDAEEFFTKLTEIEDFLTNLSIPGNRGGKFAPFYNNPKSLSFHEEVVNAALNIFRQKAFSEGDDIPLPEEIIKSGNIARLMLDASISSKAFSAADVCRLRLENREFSSVREEVRMAVRKFSENPAFLVKPAIDFQDYLHSLQIHLNKIIAADVKSVVAENIKGKRVSVCFAGMVAGKGTGKELARPDAALRSILNNLPVKAQLPKSICHYYISMTDENAIALSDSYPRVDWI